MQLGKTLDDAVGERDRLVYCALQANSWDQLNGDLLG
jgi:hypothetical protein